MGLLLILLSPIFQIRFIIKKLNGRSERSILGITLLMMLITIPLAIVGILLTEFMFSFRKDAMKCDMTIPGAIGLTFWMMIIIPIIGIIGAALQPPEDPNNDENENSTSLLKTSNDYWKNKP